MNIFGRHVCQLRNIATDVFSLLIELLALGDGIKDAEEGCGIGTTTGDPLPARAITREVCIHEAVPKPPFPLMPMN